MGSAPDQAIVGCTTMLEGDTSEDRKGRAVVYILRALAYGKKAQYDRAIADFSEAIQLNPKYPGIFSDRGGTYYAKADYDNAIMDFSTQNRQMPFSYGSLTARRDFYFVSAGNAKR